MNRRASSGRFATKAAASPTQARRAEEEAIQRTFVHHFLMHRGDCEGFSIPNELGGGGKAAKIRTARMKAMGLRAGVGDYCVFWRDGNACAMVFIEFKTASGRQQESQKDFEAAAKAAGADYVLCRSWEEAWRALQERGAPLARILAPSNIIRFVPNPNRSVDVDGVSVPIRGAIS